MKITLTTESGQSATFDVEPGENVWIAGPAGEAGSLYLSNNGETIGLGRYMEETAEWDYAETIPVGGLSYSRAEIVNGTGWAPGTKFRQILPSGDPSTTTYTRTEIINGTGWARGARFVR